MRVEDLSIEPDEGGFALHITGPGSAEDDYDLTFFLHPSQAVDLYKAVIDQIGGWLAEGLAAARAYERERPYDHEEDAYEITDPKHPRYLEAADTIRDRLRGK